jgi:hypothetical protein
MAAIYILDFEDIYTAILELLKIQASDTVTLARIKRNVNIAYEDVISRHNWWWNRAVITVQLPARLNSGTLAITQGATAVTFSSSISPSVANYKLKIQGSPEVYTISTHTSGTAAATLNIAFVGATVTAATYTMWLDYVALPTDCKETFLVQHQHFTQPMISCGLEEFRRIVAQQPDRVGPPQFYTTDDQDSNGKRRLRYWPAVYTAKINLDVDYMLNFVGLDAAGDEPIMPINDRTVLFYYGAAFSWSRERNPEEFNTYFQLGEKKLAEMASKLEDSKGAPVLRVGRGYMAQKRMQRRGRSRCD